MICGKIGSFGNRKNINLYSKMVLENEACLADIQKGKILKIGYEKIKG